MTRRTLIVNPNASRVTEQRIAEVEDRLRPAETLRTEHRGHAIELARDAAGDEVWVLGGDGVVNEALNGIRDGVALGMVPAGGANVVARALGARERRISVGRVNGRRFAFSAGIGVDSEVVRELETGQRAKSGRRSSNLQYGRAVAGRLLRGYESRLEVVGMAAQRRSLSRTTRSTRMPVRCRCGSLPNASFELGLDFAAPVRATPLSSASLFARVLAGRGMAGASGVLSGHDLDRIEVRCDVPLPLQADGEDLGDVTEAVFEAERDAVTVLQ